MHFRTRHVPFSAGLLALLVSSATASDNPAVSATSAKPAKANYELAAQWTPTKVGKLVFDLAVTPHWLDEGDRFWYTFENSKGRKFYMVDPVKKTKTYVFDAVKLAAQLTAATGLPYDSQHLPITTIRFVKNDASIQFDINVPKDAVIPGEKKTTAEQETAPTRGNQNRGRRPAAAGRTRWARRRLARRTQRRRPSPSSTSWPPAS